MWKVKNVEKLEFRYFEKKIRGFLIEVPLFLISRFGHKILNSKFKENWKEAHVRDCSYRLVLESNRPFLVLKGASEKSFLVLKRVNGNSEEY